MRDVNHTTEVISGLSIFLSRLVLKVAQRMLDKMLDAWDSGQDALGRAWAELSPVTIAKKGFNKKLYEHGDMRASAYAKRTGAFSAAVGVADGKVKIHETGVPEKNIPARPVVGPLAQWAERTDIIHDVAEDLWVGTVLRGL